MAERESSYDGATQRQWDAAGVRELRKHIGGTQAELAELLGTRQQTVSEWELGSSHPRRMSQRLLRLVAEEHGFYRAASDGASSVGNAATDAATRSAEAGSNEAARDEGSGLDARDS